MRIGNNSYQYRYLIYYFYLNIMPVFSNILQNSNHTMIRDYFRGQSYIYHKSGIPTAGTDIYFVLIIFITVCEFRH